MATTTMPANPISVSLCAKENEWVAPQFHRKVHVNNRIYIEGAGIEKLGYERLTEYFSQWGSVYNVELKVNNRDGRRQKKVYGFVTFQEEGAAAACIESAKAGIEIEPGRPLSVRSAFFMPRRNSFDTEKTGGNHQNWSANSSQPGGLPTIHDSRSPSPNNNSGFATGEWKNEMANQNGHTSKMITVEDQARKLFEIFQSLPANAKDRILQILNAQQYQEEQLRAIKEIRFDDNQNGSGSSGESISSMMQHVSVNEKNDRNRIYQTSSISSMNGHAITHTTGSRDAFPDALPSSGANYTKAMNSNQQQLPMMPRYQDSNYPTNNQRNNTNNNFYGGQSGTLNRDMAQSAANQNGNYQRQWSEPIVGTNNNYEFPNANQFAAKSAARSIPQKNRNENALSLDLPESFGPSSPGVWEMPNSPPKNYGSKFNEYARSTRNDEFNY